VTGTSSGRATSGGALAPESPRTTRSTPEYIPNFPKTPFFAKMQLQPSLSLWLKSDFRDISRMMDDGEKKRKKNLDKKTVPQKDST